MAIGHSASRRASSNSTVTMLQRQACLSDFVQPGGDRLVESAMRKMLAVARAEHAFAFRSGNPDHRVAKRTSRR